MSMRHQTKTNQTDPTAPSIPSVTDESAFSPGESAGGGKGPPAWTPSIGDQFRLGYDREGASLAGEVFNFPDNFLEMVVRSVLTEQQIAAFSHMLQHMQFLKYGHVVPEEIMKFQMAATIGLGGRGREDVVKILASLRERERDDSRHFWDKMNPTAKREPQA